VSPDERLAQAQEQLAHLEEQASSRRAQLAQVEAAGLTVEEIRSLSDAVALSDPGELELARIAVVEATILATEAAIREREVDREPAMHAIEAAQAKAREAALEVQRAQLRLSAARAMDLHADLRDARERLVHLQAERERASAQRLAALTGVQPDHDVQDLSPRPALG
jgi:multidrug resistance efflux pump